MVGAGMDEGAQSIRAVGPNTTTQAMPPDYCNCGLRKLRGVSTRQQDKSMQGIPRFRVKLFVVMTRRLDRQTPHS